MSDFCLWSPYEQPDGVAQNHPGAPEVHPFDGSTPPPLRPGGPVLGVRVGDVAHTCLRVLQGSGEKTSRELLSAQLVSQTTGSPWGFRYHLRRAIALVLNG